MASPNKSATYGYSGIGPAAPTELDDLLFGDDGDTPQIGEITNQLDKRQPIIEVDFDTGSGVVEEPLTVAAIYPVMRV